MLDLGRVRIGYLWFRVVALFNSFDPEHKHSIFVQAWNANVPADAKKPNGTFGLSFVVQEGRTSAEGLAIQFGADKVQIPVSLKRNIRDTITDLVRKTESDTDLRGYLMEVGFPLQPLPGKHVEVEASAEPQPCVTLYEVLRDLSEELGDEGTLATVQWRGHNLRVSGCSAWGTGIGTDPAFFVLQKHESEHSDERVLAYVTVSNSGADTILAVTPSAYTEGMDKKLVFPRHRTTTRNQAKTVLIKFTSAAIRGYELKDEPERRKATAAAEPQPPVSSMTTVMREFALPIEGGYYGNGEIKVPVKLNQRTIDVSFFRLALGSDNLCEVFARVKERGNPRMWVVTVMTDDLRRDKPWFYIVSPLSAYNAASSRKPITALRSALTVASRKDIDERLPALARIYANLYLLEASKQGATAAAEPGPRTPLLRSLLLAGGREVKLPGLYGDAHVYVEVVTSVASTSVILSFVVDHETMEVRVGISDSDTPTESVKATARKVFPGKRGSEVKKIDIDVLHKEVESWSASKLVRRIVEQVLRVKQDLVKAMIWPESETASASAEPRQGPGLRNERTSVSRVFPKITKIADTLHDSGAAHTDKVYKKAGGVVELTCLDISGITATSTAAITFRFETCVSGAPKPKATDIAFTVVRLLASAVPAESRIEVYTFKKWQAGVPLLEKTIKVGLAGIESKLTLVASRDEAHKAAAQLAAVIAYHTLPLVQGLASKLGDPDVE